MDYDELFEEDECPNCHIQVPARQIENIGICEKCLLEDMDTDNHTKNLNPDHHIIDKWKLETTGVKA